jgi:hypothetical protein
MSDTQPLDRPPSKMKAMVAPVALVVGVIAIALSVVALTRSSHNSHLPKSATPASTQPTCQTEVSASTDFLRSARSHGIAAYESQPVNIAGNGTYVLVFGPLTPADASRFPPRGSGLGVSFPANRTFQAQPDLSHIATFKVNGAIHLRLPIVVTDFTQPCVGLRALLQS